MPLGTRERLLEAAVACYATSGSCITMDEVAARAGVTRRTLYRAFPDRRALVEAIATTRLRHIVVRVKPRLEAKKRLPDILVTGFLEFMREARADLVFISALDEASDWDLERFLIGPNEAFAQLANTLWRESIERSIETGEWLAGLDVQFAIDWLRSVAVILLLRDDLKAAGQERLVRSFVVPALVAKNAIQGDNTARIMRAGTATSSKRRKI